MQSKTLRGRAASKFVADALTAEFEQFREAMTKRLASFDDYACLYTTDVEGLFEAYLKLFPPSERQHYNCNCCRRFIETYGGLVGIEDDLTATSVFWPDTSMFAALGKLVEKANVTGVFLASETTWGTPMTNVGRRPGPWTHLAAVPNKLRVYPRHGLVTAGQAMAAKLEDLKNVERVLGEFPTETLQQAVQLLSTDALYRSEKVLGQATWLYELQDAYSKASRGRKKNLALWKAVGPAPAGFCHPRSSMISTLLDDLSSGVSYERAARNFAAKMDPLRYQRPQAAPKAGNIAQAEKEIEKLQASGSLERRFARLDELQLLWRPRTPKQASGVGVFGHIIPKDVVAESYDAIRGGKVNITFEKFVRTVLPTAEEITYDVVGAGPFGALVTAMNRDAPPILQWDSEDERNPVSWYTYPGGTPAHQWSLRPYSTVKVTGICLKPTMWGDPEKFAHQGRGAVVILEGAVDTNKHSGNALFPECLRSELHGVRATIEAYSRKATLYGRASASACGVLLGSTACDVTLKVKANGVVTTYHVDRWD